MKILQFFLYTFLVVESICAQPLQNLVRNPSFEQYKNLPEDLGQIAEASFHSSANQSGADYFHKRCKNPVVTAPKNKMGQASPRTGDAYAGFYAYTNRYTHRDYREYVQLQLKQPMLKDHEYCIRVHVYLSESSNRGVLHLGFATSKYALAQDGQTVINIANQALYNSEKKHITQREWVEVSTIYKAQGGETHILIGNFLLDKDTKVTGAIEFAEFKNPNVDFAYYFLDDICVTDLKFNFTCDCGNYDYIQSRNRETIVMDARLARKSLNLNEPTILENVSFEKDKATFISGSSKALDELALILSKNPSYRIEISGHTNDRGAAEENQILSKRRAKAVYDYLLATGIEGHRLSYRGYGQSRPIALNNSAENRAKNERIQIILIAK